MLLGKRRSLPANWDDVSFPPEQHSIKSWNQPPRASDWPLPEVVVGLSHPCRTCKTSTMSPVFSMFKALCTFSEIRAAVKLPRQVRSTEYSVPKSPDPHVLVLRIHAQVPIPSVLTRPTGQNWVNAVAMGVSLHEGAVRGSRNFGSSKPNDVQIMINIAIIHSDSPLCTNHLDPPPPRLAPPVRLALVNVSSRFLINSEDLDDLESLGASQPCP